MFLFSLFSDGNLIIIYQCGENNVSSKKKNTSG